MRKPLYCENSYIVDSDGYIISKRDSTPLKPSINHSGYKICTIMVNGKRKSLSVARAVAIAFVDGYAKGLQVNHIDGDKTNNKFDNLEWTTPKQNMIHSASVLGNGFGAKNHNAKAIIAKDKEGRIHGEYASIADAARIYSKDTNYQYTLNSIWRVLKGTRKTYRGLKWKYKN